MTNYSPYQPPPMPSGPYGYMPTPGDDLRQPARWAGWIMIFIGAIMMLMGAAFIAISNVPEFMHQSQVEPQMQEYERLTQMPREQVVRALGIMVLVPGIVLAVSGFFARRGGRGAVWVAIVLCAFLSFFLVLNLLSAFRMGAQAAGGICFAGVGLALIGFALTNLFKALRNVTLIEQQQNQYAAMWWQYQQQGQQPYPPQYPPQYPPGYPPQYPPQGPGQYPPPPPPPPPAQ